MANNLIGFNKKSQQGATMVEILVAVLIFSIGLLGIVSTQTLGLSNSQSSLSRSYATQLSYEYIDIMRANMTEVDNAVNVFNGYSTLDNVAFAVTPSCMSQGSGCTTAQMASTQIAQWEQRVQSSLPAGEIQVSLTGGIYSLIISWDDFKGNQAAIDERENQLQNGNLDFDGLTQRFQLETEFSL